MDTLAYRQHVMYKRQAQAENATKELETVIFNHKHHHTRNATETPRKYFLLFLPCSNIYR